jgi:hypothetical protein
MTLPASIVLHDDRDADGRLHGELVIGTAKWTITAWRKGADATHILFDATDAPDPEFDALMERMARMVSSP